jgi:hypothetical protein
MGFDVINIKPESSETVKSIFREACRLENREEKLGKTLTRKENEIRVFILTKAPVLGRIPTRDEIREEFKNVNMDVLLKKLDRLDIIHLVGKTIVAAYPFSGEATAHKVLLGGGGCKTVFAMCAIDALGISFMFDASASVESSCHHCGERIEVLVKDGKIVLLKPSLAVLWCGREYGECAATSVCRDINFFSSKEHFLDWGKNRSMGKGNLLKMGEALYLGKMFFEKRIGDIERQPQINLTDT